MTHRLFISLELPDEIKQTIFNITCQSDFNDIKWESLDKLHFTIKFLGEVPKELTDSIENSIWNSLTGFKQFNITFNRFGFFLNKGIPVIFYLAIKQNNYFHELKTKIDEGLSGLGFTNEQRTFKPHITLLRMKKKNDIVVYDKFNNRNIDEFSFIAKEISLVKSTLKPQGSVYQKLTKFVLP